MNQFPAKRTPTSLGPGVSPDAARRVRLHWLRLGGGAGGTDGAPRGGPRAGDPEMFRAAGDPRDGPGTSRPGRPLVLCGE
jgi:hypothetical protein